MEVPMSRLFPEKFDSVRHGSYSDLETSCGVQSRLQLASSLFLVVTFLLSPFNIAYSDVYIKNGDFEPVTSGIPAGEEPNDDGWGTQVTISACAEEKYSGKQSLKITDIEDGKTLCFYPGTGARDFPIRIRRDDGDAPYSRFGVKFGGWFKSSKSTLVTNAQIKVTLTINRSGIPLSNSILENVYDFEDGGWQHCMGEFWLTTPDPSMYTYTFKLSVSISDYSEEFDLYADDIYVLPNLVDNGDLEYDTPPGSIIADLFGEQTSGDFDVEYESSGGNHYIEMTIDNGYFGDLIKYSNKIINAEDESNKVLDFSYMLKLFDDTEQIRRSAVSATIRCMDLYLDKDDRTFTRTPFNNYITTDTGRNWYSYSASIHNPSLIDEAAEKCITFDFSNNSINTIQGDVQQVPYIYGIDSLWVSEAVPHFAEILDFPTTGEPYLLSVSPSENTEDPLYPGELSTLYADVEIAWKTDLPTCGGSVEFIKNSNVTESVNEDLDFIPKTNHRVRARLLKYNGSITAYSFTIKNPGMKRGYTESGPHNLVDPATYTENGTQQFGFSSPVSPQTGSPLPVLFGVPLPTNELSDELDFTIQKSPANPISWSPVPTQTRILSHWFDHFDGQTDSYSSRGIKWLLTSFLWEKDRIYRINYNTNVNREPDENDFIIDYIQPGSGPPYYAVSNQSSGTTLDFRIPYSGSGSTSLLYNLEYNGNNVLSTNNIRAAIQLDGDPLSYGEVGDVKIVYNGEVCGVIEITMSHQTSSQELLYSVVRITVFKDQPYILFDYGVMNDSKSKMLAMDSQEDYFFTIERMFLEVNLDTQSATSSLKYVFDGKFQGPLLVEDDIYLLQEGEELLQIKEETQDDYIGTLYDFSWSANGNEPYSGETTGWFGIFDEDSQGLPHQVFTGIPNFSEQFPAELHLERPVEDRTTFYLEFVPGNLSAQPDPTEITAKLPYSSRISYQNVFLYLADNDDEYEFTDTHMSFFDDPPLVIFPPSYYEDTRVFGPLIPEYSFSVSPVQEEMVDLFNYYQDLFVKHGNNQTGVLTLDYHLHTPPSDEKYNKKGFCKEYWQEYRITDRRAHIVSNEYEIGSVFGRLGNILEDDNSRRDLYYRAARREGRYLLDRIFHWTPYEDVRQYNEEVWLPKGIPHHHSLSVHLTGYDSGHCQGVPILDWYYGNTGDSDALDMITSFADAICLNEAEKFKSIDQYQMGGLERHLGWPLYTLVQAYLATGDPYYILNAKTIVDKADSFLIDCPNCQDQKCYVRLIKEVSGGKFKYVALGGQTFTTAVLNQAVAKYHETSGETAASDQSETVGLFLKSLYNDDYDRFYKDSYHQSGTPTGIVNLLMVSPGLKYIGLVKSNQNLESFADKLIQDYNDVEDPDVRIKPKDELKQHGQITNFVLDFMKYYKEDL